MASVIDVCNLALSNIRAGSINSLTEASLAAQQCRLKYEIMRDQTLKDAPWQFARKVEALATLTDDAFNWAYVYQYPSDCLQVRKLLLNWEEVQSGTGDTVSRHLLDGYPRLDIEQHKVKYQIQNIDGNRVIVANDPELRAEYTKQVEDPNLFSSTFIIALSHLLGAELAVPLVGAELGRQLRSDNYSIYQSYIESATASDLNEQSNEEPDSEFITVRS